MQARPPIPVVPCQFSPHSYSGAVTSPRASVAKKQNGLGISRPQASASAHQWTRVTFASQQERRCVGEKGQMTSDSVLRIRGDGPSVLTTLSRVTERLVEDQQECELSSHAMCSPSSSFTLDQMHLQIEYQNGEKRSPLEIDLNETVEFLKLQLYSLTDIPPQQQHILGLAPGVTLTDNMLLRAVGFQAGQRLIVKKRLTGDTPIPESSSSSASNVRPALASSSHHSAPIGARGVHDLQACCTRSFFGPEAIIQPSAFVGDAVVCFTCAKTCHKRESLKPRVSQTAVVCGCAAIPNHTCVYAARSTVAADLLTGMLNLQAKMALASSATQSAAAQQAAGQAQMQARINAHARAIMDYENPQWQDAARKLIPLQELIGLAQKAIQSGEGTAGPRDELLNQLLIWFKHRFFRWVNSPECGTCGKGTGNIGATQPNAEELPHRPGVVELYRCEDGHVTRFPRYNSALKLLETRRGRCGEFAQAFTLCCRALGFEARSANDWTDHVWTEYFSEEQQRWIHADSCEARRDAPMLYEAGWGKKLTYVIACSKDEVLDVTQRYSKKWTEVLERRANCPEDWLKTYCSSLTQIKSFMMAPTRLAVLAERRVKELAEFAANVAEEQANKVAAREAAVSEAERQGRITGSVEWRQARGELGSDAIAVERALNPDLVASGASSTKAPPTTSASSSSSSSASPSSDPLGVCVPAEKALCSTDPVPVQKLAALGLDSSSPAPTPTPIVAAPSAIDPVAAAKAKTAALFKSYVKQLGVGCGHANCQTPECKSNPNFAAPTVAQDIGKRALEMVKRGPSELCPHLQ